MCLRRIKNIYPGTSTEEEIGYKVFDKRLDFPGLALPFYSYGFENMKPGVWLEALSQTIFADYPNEDTDDVRYMSGFHIFVHEADALRWAGHRNHMFHSNSVVRKVAYKGLLASGTQTNWVGLKDLDCVVAKHMRIDKTPE